MGRFSRTGRSALGHGALAGVLMGMALVIASPVQAQITDPDAQAPSQEDMARAIDTMCPNLDARVGAADRTAEESQLNITCANLFFNDGVDGDQDLDGDGEDDVKGFMLSEDEQLSALQSINGEELQAPQLRVGQIQDVQVSSIRARLAAIRSGLTAPGISLAGLDVDVGDRVVAMDELSDMAVVPAQFEGGAFDRLGVFVTGSVIFGDKDATGEVDGFDFNTAGITVGADYRVTDRFVLGGAVGYAHFDADFDETDTSPDGQELDSDGVQFSLFGTYFPTDQLFFDAIANVGWNFYDAERRIVVENNNGDLDLGAGPGVGIDTTATGDFDATNYGFAANAGYDVPFAGATVTPLVRLEYLRAEIDGYTEESDTVLNLEFDDQDADSFTASIGLEADYPISTTFGVISPAVRAEYVHEFIDDQDGVAIQYANDPTGTSRFEVTTADIDQDYGIVGAGVTGTFAGGWAAFVDWNTVVGLTDFDIHRVNVGLRRDF